MTVLLDNFCRLPPAANPAVVIAATSLLSDQTFQQQVNLAERLWAPTKRITEHLSRHGYRSDVIGWGPAALGSVLMKSKHTWWVFGSRVTLCQRGESILADLLFAGLPIDPDGVRVAYEMPFGWEPHDTMERVFPNVLMGAVVDDRRLVALPVTDGCSAHRIWLGVDPRRRGAASV